ncbi:hypothetical protein TKK_0010522 [Trichogramma kaykai]|uniref:XK-related protein n=1 Tax=Trichogramma kaykai TaxID=54128 RepID=A0ABD2WWN7_9HYME
MQPAANDDREQQQPRTRTTTRQPQQQHEFLPLCDVLFNIVSLASYFGDVVFDLAMAYALASHPQAPPLLFPLCIVFVVFSLFVSQLMSIKWYLWGARGKLSSARTTTTTTGIEQQQQQQQVEKRASTDKWSLGCVLLLHASQVGVLWRYFKLFIPVNLAYVKHEVRELCVLRLIHAFCEAAPMLLLQVYVLAMYGPVATVVDGESPSVGLVTTAATAVASSSIVESTGPLVGQTQQLNDSKLAELTSVSAGLSLWSVCWAVASFSKGAARRRNLERLVLTWLGVLAQLVWRLGTVSARVGALVAYASVYGAHWMLVVMGLHWLSMLTWLLLTPDGLFHAGEKLGSARKSLVAAMLAFVYVFAYVNLHETNHRQKMLIFYSVMLLENSLLVGVWAVGVGQAGEPATLLFSLAGLFLAGLCFMGLYYRFFHVRRLQYEANGRARASDRDHSHGGGLNALYSEKSSSGCYYDDKCNRKNKLSNSGIPGVFNCRFAVNPAVSGNANRKKKKPTSFVPPPTQLSIGFDANNPQSGKWPNNDGPQLIPFWKRPLSIASATNTTTQDEERSAKNETPTTTPATAEQQSIAASLSVNLIHEKLRAKKQQQLRELRAIQEEIKEGKIVPPPAVAVSSRSPPSQAATTTIRPPLSNEKLVSPPACRTVAANWPPVKMHCLLLAGNPVPTYYETSALEQSVDQWQQQQQQQQRLAVSSSNKRSQEPPPELLLAPNRLQSADRRYWAPVQPNVPPVEEDASDMDGSQISLPRNYALPQESRKQSKTTSASTVNGTCRSFYLPSTNSSDGDIDSADNEDETDTELRANGIVARSRPYVLESTVSPTRSHHQHQQFASNISNNNSPSTKFRPETKL